MMSRQNATGQPAWIAMMGRRRARTAGRWVVFCCLIAGLSSWWCAAGAAQQKYSDRLVWVFGWNVRQDQDVAQLEQLLTTPAFRQ